MGSGGAENTDAEGQEDLETYLLLMYAEHVAPQTDLLLAYQPKLTLLTSCHCVQSR